MNPAEYKHIILDPANYSGPNEGDPDHCALCKKRSEIL